MYPGTISAPEDARFASFESSIPSELASKLNTFIASLPDGSVIASLALAGSGQGATFVATLMYTTVAGATFGGIVIVAGAVVARAYAGSTPASLSAQRAAVTFPADFAIVLHEVAGSSDGNVYMGVFLAETTSIAPNFATAHGQIAGDGMANALAPGVNPVVGAVATGIAVAAGYQFDSPAAGVLRYLGAAPIRVRIEAIAVVQVATPFTATLNIKRAIDTTPVQLGTSLGVTFVANLHAPIVNVAFTSLSQDDTIGISIDDLGGVGELNAVSLDVVAL